MFLHEHLCYFFLIQSFIFMNILQMFFKTLKFLTSPIYTVARTAIIIYYLLQKFVKFVKFLSWNFFWLNPVPMTRYLLVTRLFEVRLIVHIKQQQRWLFLQLPYLLEWAPGVNFGFSKGGALLREALIRKIKNTTI